MLKMSHRLFLPGWGLAAADLKKQPAGRIYELGGPDVCSFRQLMALTLQYSQRRRLLVPIPFAAMAVGARCGWVIAQPAFDHRSIAIAENG